MKSLKKFFKDENGQGMVEYGLILGLVAVAAIAALIILGPKITGIFDSANSKIPAM
ncbi:MAG: Flp family type IVb pilin [Christensenellales bacterium]